MNIGIIVRKLTVFGGVQRHVISLASECHARGHKVTIYTFLFDEKNTFSQLPKDIKIVSLGFFPKYRNIIQFLIDEERASVELAKKITPDTEILNPHDHTSFKVAAMYKKKRNIPSVWTMHDLPTKIFSFIRSGKKVTIFNFIKIIIYKLIDWYEWYRFIRPQDSIVVLDERDRIWVKKFFKKEAVIVRNGISIKSFPFVLRVVSLPNVRILMTGIFLPHRRFEDGLVAVSILKKQNFVPKMTIVGAYDKADPYYKKIIQIINDYDLSHDVRLVGIVSDDELKKHYQTNDVFLFPNALQSWGLTVFEAMASGLPVVVSKEAGASEVLTDGKDASIVQCNDPESIVEAVSVLVNDPVLFENRVNNGKALVEGMLSWERHGREMEAVFLSVLRKG